MTTLPTELLKRRTRRGLQRSLRCFVVGLLMLAGLAYVAAAQETQPNASAPLLPLPPGENSTLFSQRGQTPSTSPTRQIKPARPTRPHRPATAGASSAPSPAIAPGRPAKVAPPSPATPPAPYRVVTVVHRLSGWKLLSLLAASAPPALELDDLPSASYVHTNVVAGFLSDDNRTVVARLPQAEVEVVALNASTLLPGFAPSVEAAGQSEYALVLADGRRFPARFVGLDAATGLSLLEATEPIPVSNVIGDTGHTEDPTVGQRLVFYAPVPVAAGEAAQRKAAEAKAAAPRALTTVGEEGVVYSSVTRAEGQLTEVVRAPSGRAYAFTAEAGKVSPAWTGAVATDNSGSLVGIVSRSEAGLTQIVPVETLRLAVERVKTKRSSVPQPWLGARGDSAANAPLELWVNKGWERARAFSLIQNKGGVLLTSVAPGTPAALAGLRPGDLISRVGGREVRTAQDFSLLLKEQPIGSAVEFTVVRPPQPEPVKLSVRLSGTQNPALATAEAETRAARESLLTIGAQLRVAREEQFSAANSAFETPAALARLKEAETKFETALREATEASRRIYEAQPRTLFGPQMAPPAAGDEQTQRPLLFVGLRAVALSPRGAARLGARAGFLVMMVEEGSPAAACGLRPGDVIETAGGQPLTRNSFQQLLRAAWAAPVKLGVVRAGHRTSVEFSFSHDCAK
jgi:S1-C subfamily serine protease